MPKANSKTAPLPPPPSPAEFVYGSDPLTGAFTAEPAGIRGAVTVPLDRLGEYYETYGLEPDRGRPGGALVEIAGAGWVLFVRRKASHV